MDDILKYFSYFSLKIGIDISCRENFLEMSNSVFWEKYKNKKNIINLSFAELAQKVQVKETRMAAETVPNVVDLWQLFKVWAFPANTQHHSNFIRMSLRHHLALTSELRYVFTELFHKDPFNQFTNDSFIGTSIQYKIATPYKNTSAHWKANL